MKYQHRVLGMLSLLSVITYLDRVCIAVAGPRMQDALHISPQAWGWVTSVFFLSYSAFEIPTGALGDRIGPRRVLTRIVVWWSASPRQGRCRITRLVAGAALFGAGRPAPIKRASAVIGSGYEARVRPGHRVDDHQVGAALRRRSSSRFRAHMAGALLRVRPPGSCEPAFACVEPGFAS